MADKVVDSTSKASDVVSDCLAECIDMAIKALKQLPAWREYMHEMNTVEPKTGDVIRIIISRTKK